MKVALVHDQLTQYGGAERVLDVLHEMFPDSPVYTTVYLHDKLPESYKSWDIRTSFVDKLPFVRESHKLRAPLFPDGIQSFNLKDYDVIISDTQGIAKGIKTHKNQLHVSYFHTIPWLIWGIKNQKGRFFAKFFGRKWDYKTAQNPNVLIANSNTTRDRIKKFYNRDAQVIYPPVEIKKLQSFVTDYEKEDYIVFVGRLEGYKGELEIAKACTEVKMKLIIIGKGRNENILKSYSPFVELKNNVGDKEKAQIVAKAKALFNGSIEDFGINMVEALALGTPVIALGQAGAAEIIENGKTGIFIDNLDINGIVKSMQMLSTISTGKIELQKSVERFDRALFIKSMKEVLDQHLQK